jgi:phosphoribosylformylglycinamidine synthase
MKPRVCILKTDGTNCDQETAHAFTIAGATVDTVLFKQLLDQKIALKNYQILVIPGGFSYGDDIASGKILALELMLFLQHEINNFIANDKLILGICNGFQVLARAQLLPYPESTSQTISLIQNDSAKFECRWVSLKIEPNHCVFTQNMPDEIMLPVAHAEGKFFALQHILDHIEKKQLVALRYAHDGHATDQFPFNPNGSLHNIAGVCDTTGRILGLMPHPERFVYPHQHPLTKRTSIQPAGKLFFENAVRYFQ